MSRAPLNPMPSCIEPQDRSRTCTSSSSAGLSMLVLADIGVLPSPRRTRSSNGSSGGGVLLRFAGPRLAGGQDDLVPVTLREGDRSLGSALSWEEPQPCSLSRAKPLRRPDRSTRKSRVARQVLAEPDADLPPKVWASLADGTPLVTAEAHGKGLVVLVPCDRQCRLVESPAFWLFVDMLRRIVDLAPGAGGGAAGGAAATEREPPTFTPRRMLAGNGDLVDPSPESRPDRRPPRSMPLRPSPKHPAGLYSRGSSERAINLAFMQGEALTPIGALPSRRHTSRSRRPRRRSTLRAAVPRSLLLFLLDCAAASLCLPAAGGCVSHRRPRRSHSLLGAAGMPARPMCARRHAGSGRRSVRARTIRCRPGSPMC